MPVPLIPLILAAARLAPAAVGAARAAGGIGAAAASRGAAGAAAGGVARAAGSMIKSPVTAFNIGQMVGGMGGDSAPRETRNDSFSRGLTTSDPASEASRLAYVHNLNS